MHRNSLANRIELQVCTSLQATQHKVWLSSTTNFYPHFFYHLPEICHGVGQTSFCNDKGITNKINC